MSADELEQAVRALRETTARHPLDGQRPDAVDARFAAIWDDVPARRAPRASRWLMAAVVVIGVGSFTGWAGATGRLGRAFEAAAAWVRPANQPAAPVTPAPRPRAAPRTRPLPPPPLVPEEKPAEAPPRDRAAAAPPRAPSRAMARAPAALPPALPPQGSAPANAEALYDQAHRAQFVDRDYAAAVRAWDRYLRTPEASLLPEARYSRAIALYRLGHLQQAAAALAPFARGEYGSYRREEARALLSRVRAARPTEPETRGDSP